MKAQKQLESVKSILINKFDLDSYLCFSKSIYVILSMPIYVSLNSTQHQEKRMVNVCDYASYRSFNYSYLLEFSTLDPAEIKKKTTGQYQTFHSCRRSLRSWSWLSSLVTWRLMVCFQNSNPVSADIIPQRQPYSEFSLTSNLPLIKISLSSCPPQCQCGVWYGGPRNPARASLHFIRTLLYGVHMV